MAALDKMAAIKQRVQLKIDAKNEVLYRYQWRSFFLTYVLYICFYLSRKPFSTVKDTLKDPTELNLTDENLGQIETIFLVTYACAQFIVGPFGDKYGARKLLLISLLGTSISCYLMSQAQSLSDLRVAWGLNGMFQAAAFPLMMKALSPWYANANLGKILGYWTTCQQIGGTIAVSLAGYVASGGFDRKWLGENDGSRTTWRDSFLLPAGLAAAAAVVTYFAMVEHPRDIGLKSPSAANKNKKISSSTKKSKSNATFMDVVRLPYLLNVGMAYFCIKLVRYTMLTWSVSYLKGVHGYEETQAAVISTLFDIGGAFGAIACSIIAARFFNGRRINAVFVLCLLSGLCTGVYGVVAGFGTYTNMMMLFVTGFMIAGPDSVLGGAACSDVCQRAGYDTSVLTTATGIANGMGSVGAILAGSGPVWVKNNYGWNTLFVGAGGLAILGAMFLLPLVRDFEQKEDVTKKKK
jgi:OPA family sugar phosphate sensor protein UhpC-like MFS transporter